MGGSPPVYYFFAGSPAERKKMQNEKVENAVGAMKILCRQSPLEWRDWIGMVHARRTLFRKLLGSITLKRLGQFGCLPGRSGDNEHNIINDNPDVIADPGFDLNTQGVFAPLPTEWSPTGDGTMVLWGVTRKRDVWLVVTLNLANESGYHRVVKAVIQSVGLEELLVKTGQHPRDIFQKFHEVTSFWVELYFEKYRMIKDVRKQMDVEKQALDLVG